MLTSIVHETTLVVSRYDLAPTCNFTPKQKLDAVIPSDCIATVHQEHVDAVLCTNDGRFLKAKLQDFVEVCFIFFSELSARLKCGNNANSTEGLFN